MFHLLSSVFLTLLISAINLKYCCEGTSIILSPLGVVSVCPEGQVLLTCERTSGAFLYWTVSVPHLAMTRETIVAKQGAISTTDIPSATFTITRTSADPLTSQMMVSDVTTETNGSVIYCSEDGNENGAPMVTINVTNGDSFLNISLMNNFLRNGIRITLQWPREPGAVYDVNVLPVTPVINVISHNSIMRNLTISYNIQYKLNVSISSSLCDATTTRVLKYVRCDLPEQLLLHRHVTVDTGSQNYPLMEGQYITYTCPPGLVLTGPNASECMENGEWEPDPRGAHCIANCSIPPVDRNVVLNYNSTLEGSILTLTCPENDTFADEVVFSVTCHSSGMWIPDPARFTCSSFTTVPPETSLRTPIQNGSGTLIPVLSSLIIIMCAISSIVFLSIGYACGWFSLKHKLSRATKVMSDPAEKTSYNYKGSQLPQTPGPLYEELQVKSTPEHEHLVELKDNVAYGPIAK